MFHVSDKQPHLVATVLSSPRAASRALWTGRRIGRVIDADPVRSWMVASDAIHSARRWGNNGACIGWGSDVAHALAPGGSHGAAQPEGVVLARLAKLCERQIQRNVKFDLTL